MLFKLFKAIARTRRRPVAATAAPTRPPLDRLVDLLIEFEGFRGKAYLCQGKVWTYGYGATRKPNGHRVREGDRITRRQARAILEAEAEAMLAKAEELSGVGTAPCALVGIASLIYNNGESAVADSQFIRAWRDGDMELAEWHFRDFKRAGGKISNGLVRRRDCEWRIITGEKQ